MLERNKNKTMKILHLISSLRGEASFSNKLGNSIIEQLATRYPIEVKERNLASAPLAHLSDAHVTAFFTPEHERTAAQIEIIRPSDEAIAELLNADILIIDVPMYNFTIPSTIKAWIDQIARAGITFRYGENGVEGLVTNKKAYLAISTGGIYSEGYMKDFDHTEQYLRHVLGFLGITNMEVFRVEGVNLSEAKEDVLSKAKQHVEEFDF